MTSLDFRSTPFLALITCLLTLLASPFVSGCDQERISNSKALAIKGDPVAQKYMADAYYHGTCVPWDRKKAYRLYKKSASQGFVDAQRELGYIYAEGIGGGKNLSDSQKPMPIIVPQDFNSAEHWLLKAAVAGDYSAQSELGRYYLTGVFGSSRHEGQMIPDLGKAYKWLHKAADNTELSDKSKWPALQMLGEYYDGPRGNGSYHAGQPIEDNALALMYLKRAYEGLEYSAPDATDLGGIAFNIAMLYYNGHGLIYQNGEKEIPIDYQKAISWFEKGAKAGDVACQAQLGFAYLDGIGALTNYNDALYWLRRAGRNGHSVALLRLGYMYEEAVGVAKNNDIAYALYNLASVKGYKKAQQARSAVKINMTHKEISKAQQLSRECEQVVTAHIMWDRPPCNYASIGLEE